MVAYCRRIAPPVRCHRIHSLAMESHRQTGHSFTPPDNNVRSLFSWLEVAYYPATQRVGPSDHQLFARSAQPRGHQQIQSPGPQPGMGELWYPYQRCLLHHLWIYPVQAARKGFHLPCRWSFHPPHRICFAGLPLLIQ